MPARLLDHDHLLTRRRFMSGACAALTGLAESWTEAARSAEAEVKPPRFLLAWGKLGKKEGEFRAPIAIAINAADDILVTDLHNARVQKFTPEGKFLSAFDLPKDSNSRTVGAMSSAGGIAVDQKGLVYVSIWASHNIRVYDQAGKFVKEWGKFGTGDGEFDTPGGMAFAADGSIYVADQLNRRVQKLTPEGMFLAKWGGHGTKAGQFDGIEPPKSRFGGPHFVALDSKGNVFTTEGVAGRIQQFSGAGKPLQSWGNKTSEPGGFGSLRTPYSSNSFGPIGICTDKKDRVWVSSLNNRVQMFTSEGKYLAGMGGEGSEPGQFHMPHAMAVDSKGHLYVVDSSNSRIQKFAVPA